MRQPDWQSEDGRHRMWCGDCLELLPQMEAGSVDAVVTDPPYGVSLKGKRTKRAASHINEGYAAIDDLPEIIDSVVVPAINLCIEKFGRVVVTPGTRNMFRYPSPADVGGIFNPSGAGLGKWGFTCIHPVLFYGKCPYLANGMGHRPNGFKDIAAGEKVDGHPCPKPIRWMEWMVRKASNDEEQTILDPFTGSGTTGVACVKTGRRFMGIELHRPYFEIAVKRMEAAIREQAERLIPA